jgi:FdrA protein
MTLAASVFPRLYRDSVALLALASKLQQREHIVRAGVVMATPANLRLLAESDMLPDGVAAGADDLLIAVKGGDPDAVEEALTFASTALSSTDAGSQEASAQRPQTIVEGIADRPGATVATVSVPGTYAAIVAEQALRRGLHVMCFSDNVPVEDEVRLKALAAQRRLLMMGPDCGTAVLDGVPLGFANVLRPGPVGIVAASGTGAQEVSCLLDRAGVGNASLIGVGGRDLTAPVGGVMTELALDLLVADRSAEVIVVVSKPPAPAVAERLLSRLELLAATGTPVVACLLGMDDADEPVAVRGTLEGAAIEAARLAGVTLAPAVAEPTEGTAPAGGVLGLYTGGTLAAEAKVLFGRAGLPAEVIDLGDDQYTAGRPHPMIDPAARAERIAAAGADPTVGVVLLDVVLGHGAHPDPAGAVAAAVREARAAAERPMAFVASVCGTAADPQGFDAQARSLREAGVLLAGSNAAATRLAIQLAGRVDGRVNGEGGRP